MKFKNIRYLLIFFLFILVYTKSYSALNIVQEYELNEFINKLVDDLNITGISVVITENGSPIYENNTGYKLLPTEETEGIYLKKDDLFTVASISKTFIATVIMKLEEEELLNIEDNVENYLPFPIRNPNFPDKLITIEMLLTHTSSLQDVNSSYSIHSIIPGDKEYSENIYLKGVPGEIYKYCNLNYNLLGAIIESVTKTRFDKVVDFYIINPMNLNATFNYFDIDKEKFVNQYVYSNNLKQYIIQEEYYNNLNNPNNTFYTLSLSTTSSMKPSGSLIISANDLAKYLNLHLNNGEYENIKIITKEDEERMRKNYVGKFNYGYSFRQYQNLYPNRILYGQTGGGKGIRSAMIFDPIGNLGFVILTSGSKSKFIDGYEDIHKPIIKEFYSIYNK